MLDPYRDFEYDDMGYTYGEKLKISNDEISLDNESVLTKLAVSHGKRNGSNCSKLLTDCIYRCCPIY